MPHSPVQAAIQRVAAGEDLSGEEIGAAFDVVMQGEASAVQIAALLVGLRAKGETPEEVAGVVTAMRHAMVRVHVHRPEDVVDTCGTGGGTVPTFNISTAAALVAAGAGVRVAKHGNRSFTSRCGSADVLQALGVPIEVPLATIERALAEAGIAFMFAPAFHPAMRHVIPVRRELAIPTVMNIVGPLSNPASAGRQVVGVADPGRMGLIAAALAVLGTIHALVVHGEEGMDEISPFGATRILEVRDGVTREWLLRPADVGLPDAAAADLVGGGPEDNARLIEELLRGRGSPGARAAVELNAAAAIYVGGLTRSYPDAVLVGRAALADGRALDALERLRRAHAPEPVTA